MNKLLRLFVIGGITFTATVSFAQGIGTNPSPPKQTSSGSSTGTAGSSANHGPPSGYSSYSSQEAKHQQAQKEMYERQRKAELERKARAESQARQRAMDAAHDRRMRENQQRKQQSQASQISDSNKLADEKKKQVDEKMNMDQLQALGDRIEQRPDVQNLTKKITDYILKVGKDDPKMVEELLALSQKDPQAFYNRVIAGHEAEIRGIASEVKKETNTPVPGTK